MPFFLSIVKDVQISPFYALTIKGETHIFWGIFCVSHYKNILDIRKIADQTPSFRMEWAIFQEIFLIFFGFENISFLKTSFLKSSVLSNLIIKDIASLMV